MPEFITRIKKYYLPILLGFLVLLVLIPISPHFVPVSGADPGVFVYIGDQILDGDIPYRDHFGNKGPLTYYLNALGLLIRRGSLWGVWAIQIPMLFFSALIAYKVIFEAFGNWPALFGSVTWILNLSLVLHGGNFTEEYAILFQFGSLLFFWFSEKQPTRKRFPLLVGVSFALSFLLRPNNIGISVSILLFLGFTFLFNKEERSEAFKRILLILLGFASVLTVVALYFLSQEALGDLVDAVFRFNLLLNVTEGSIVSAILTGIDRLSLIFLIAFVAWFLAIVRLLSSRKETQAMKSLLAVMVIGLPVELFLATFGGKGIGHYFISWLPILGLLSAFFAYRLLEDIKENITLFGRKTPLASIWLSAILFMIVLQPAYKLLPPTTQFISKTLRTGQLTRAEYSPQDAEMVDLITRQTEEGEYLLIWGFEFKYYFMTNRESPSRFAYQYPFATPGFATPEMIDQFILDISTKRPLIIDSSISDGSNIPWIGAPKWENIPGMDKVMDFIFTHYAVTALVGPEKWPVYEYVGIE